jgi:hypothetical protein
MLWKDIHSHLYGKSVTGTGTDPELVPQLFFKVTLDPNPDQELFQKSN